jgi:polysaccharide export outer membrane protein
MKQSFSSSIQTLLLIFLLGSFSGCISHESLINYGDRNKLPLDEATPIINPRTIIIQPSDVLDIKVHSQDILTAAPFNLNPPGSNTVMANPELNELSGYLVDGDGYINFPVLGKISLLGMTIKEAKAYLLGKLEEYLKEPVINIRYLNFKVTVSGEINRPGSFTVYNERITLPEVITKAGDFTPYANRRSIFIIREENGKRIFAEIDMGTPDFFASQYYFLKQNDLVYVEPLEAKRGAVRDNSNKVLPFVSAFVSIAALLISVFK